MLVEGEHRDCYRGFAVGVQAGYRERRKRFVVAFRMDLPVAAHRVVSHKLLQGFPAEVKHSRAVRQL